MRPASKLLRFVWSLMRELSDEAAYARYLHTTGRKNSAAEWQRFSDWRYRRKYRNAKCC